jgi:phage shock protein A
MPTSASIQDVYDELKRIERRMVTKEKLAEMVDSLAILSNNDTMKQISASKNDIKNGKFKEVTSVKDILA